MSKDPLRSTSLILVFSPFICPPVCLTTVLFIQLCSKEMPFADVLIDGGGRDLGDREGDGYRDDGGMWEKYEEVLDHGDVPSSGVCEGDDFISN
jgi:hypothetical protein